MVQIYTCTFSTASGKFLLKNRTTSFTLELLLVLTVIMYPSPNLQEQQVSPDPRSLELSLYSHWGLEV